jgi:hypothetical protein
MKMYRFHQHPELRFEANGLNRAAFFGFFATILNLRRDRVRLDNGNITAQLEHFGADIGAKSTAGTGILIHNRFHEQSPYKVYPF